MKNLSMVLVLCSIFLLFSACGKQTLPLDSESSVVAAEQDPENPKWSFGNGEKCYEIGLNAWDMPVFKDPGAAFDQLVIDYKDTLDVIKKEFHLLKISKTHWRGYGIYGWQINTDDRELIKTGNEISSFFDIFENSFQINSPNQYV